MQRGNKRSNLEPRLAVARIASAQHGVIHLDQAVEAGLSKDAVYRRVRTGEWQRLFTKVFLAGGEGGWLADLAGACLWAGGGAAASHRSAAALWELEGIEPGLVEITCSGRKGGPGQGVLVHVTSTHLPVHTRKAIPVTSVTRTLIDLGVVVSIDTVEIALEDALRRRLTTIPRLHMALRQEAPRYGGRVLQTVLDERPSASPPTASRLETRLAIVARRARLACPVRQHPVRRPNGRVARIDFAYPDRRVGIEVDGYRWHSGRREWARDRQRTNDLTAMGWRILRVTKEDLEGDAHELVAVLRRLLDEEPPSARDE